MKAKINKFTVSWPWEVFDDDNGDYVDFDEVEKIIDDLEKKVERLEAVLVKNNNFDSLLVDLTNTMSDARDEHIALLEHLLHNIFDDCVCKDEFKRRGNELLGREDSMTNNRVERIL